MDRWADGPHQWQRGSNNRPPHQGNTRGAAKMALWIRPLKVKSWVTSKYLLWMENAGGDKFLLSRLTSPVNLWDYLDTE